MKNMLLPEPQKNYTILDLSGLNDCVKPISLEEVVINLMSYLYRIPGERWI